DIMGLRFQPIFNLWAGNELLVGFDAERSWLRSQRYRESVVPPYVNMAQVSPQDNNQTDSVMAFYAENSQRLFDD
ncbi:hypothetical protein, partial [Stenotrophomonas maltophilia]|uniref:hypothetical protein n=1 Tax=Stenotrophomonas maltophilia TaxID=40324 RepID=UPI001953A513